MRTADEYAAWDRGADHYAELAGAHTDASSQLACLVLAAYCVREGSGEYGGPSLEMVQLSESILGVTLDTVLNERPAENTPVNPERAAPL